jgi:hypothetical protein
LFGVWYFLFSSLKKTPDKGTREEKKRKDQSPNKRQHPKVQNPQSGASRGETK